MKPGASYKVFTANIAERKREGADHARAVYDAAAMYRKSWFSRYPQGALPLWACYPRDARTRERYAANGTPLHIKQNPRRMDNMPSVAEFKEAEALYSGFTGKASRTLKKIELPPMPKVGLAIGKIFGILYSVDATGERFHHEFKGKARPTLIVSHDGKQVFMRGGAYTFTKRGFVDQGGA